MGSDIVTGHLEVLMLFVLLILAVAVCQNISDSKSVVWQSTTFSIVMEKTIPPEKVDTNPKEKMKQMRLPFAPIQKENAITKQKEEQEKERQRIAIEKQLKLEAEKAAQKELDAINQR